MKNLINSAALAVLVSLAAKAQTQVTFFTNYGDFQAEIYDSIMPITGGNFLSLVDSQFYDGIIFHRVIPNFVIQGGDPNGNGFGGPGYTIPDEFDSTGTLSNVVRTISMANAGPNTGGSQFFINLKNNTFLDYDKAPLTSAHPIFGYVHSGWNVVTTIAGVATDGNDKPLSPVVMDSIRVTGSYLSVKEIEREKYNSAIYPNPISNESVLDVYCEQSSEAEIAIYDTQGKLIASKSIYLQAGKTKIPLVDLDLPITRTGVYYLTIITADGQQQLRLVKL